MLRLQVGFLGEAFSVNWNKGVLTGDFEAVSMLQDASKKLAGETHEGHTLPDNPLGDYESVIVLAMIIFDEIIYSSKTLRNEKGEIY